MGNPFAMSFDEIKAAADANMENDKASVQPQQPAAKQQEKKSGATSFLDMVEETQRKLAEENKGAKPKKEEGSAPTEAPADNPISFDEVAGQAEKAAEAAPSFDDMFAQAEGTSPISFDDMFAQAQNTDASAQDTKTPVQTEASVEEPAKDTSSGSAISFDELAAEASQSAPVQTASETPISFDDMVAEAAKAEGPTKAEEAPVTEEPAKETPVTEEPAKETLTTEEPAKETPVAEEPAKETLTTEEPAKAKPAKGKSKKAKKDDEPKEPLSDTTDEYKVDLNPPVEAETSDGLDVEKPKAEKAKPKKAQAKESKAEKPASDSASNPLSMDNLFTPDEIAGFRTIIRKFVYKEFKKAMVDATKELLAEFDE